LGGINQLKLFDLQPKENPDELFGREAEINQLVDLIKAKRWTVILGPFSSKLQTTVVFWCFEGKKGL